LVISIYSIIKKINRFLKGEHIDYCGYSVLPMAVDQDIISAFAAIDNNEVQISNVNPLFKYSKLVLFDKNIYFSSSEQVHLILINLLFPMKNRIGMNILNVVFKVFVINILI
jgi:hypothetical protein